MTEEFPAVVIGAGSAGLATSYHLKQLGVNHVVLERERVGHSWARRRWDSFTLNTPNWTYRLPGFPYEGTEPDGFMARDAIAARLELYAARFALPVRVPAQVQRLRPSPGGAWRVEQDGAELEARNVVVAVGAFPEPRVSPASATVSPRVLQLHTSFYRNHASLPEGAVLVVGSGQSGVQIAEELMDAGRTVYMSIGTCPRVPRRYRGRDFIRWFEESGYFDVLRTELPGPAMRLACNPQTTGSGGGHDVDVWRLARRGLRLIGRFTSAKGERLQFQDNLMDALAASEERSRKLLAELDDHIARSGAVAPPAEPACRDFGIPGPARIVSLDLKEAGISSLIWATGFRPTYPWIEGAAFDADGFPVTDRGVTAAPGLYFVGVHLMHTRKSGLLLGVGEDAEHVARHIAARAKDA